MISRSTDVAAALRHRQRGFLLNPFRFGSGAVTDPSWASVVLRLPLEGANNDTTTTDVSPSPKTITFVGSGKLSTGNPKWGATSFISSTNGAILCGSAAQYKFLHDGSTAWTIEGWYRCDAFSASQCFFDSTSGTSAQQGVFCGINSSRVFNVFMSLGVGGVFMASTTIDAPVSTWPNDNAYHFLQVTYDPALTSHALMVRVDGVTACDLTKQANTPSTSNPPVALILGAFGSYGQFINGSIDDARVTTVVRANVVPTAAFPTS